MTASGDTSARRRLLFRLLGVPPVMHAVLSLGLALSAPAAGQVVNWSGMGFSIASIILVLASFRAQAKGHRISAGVLMFAAYAPLIMAILVFALLRLT